MNRGRPWRSPASPAGQELLINLVAKFYLPTGGEVLIDSREIRTLTGRSLSGRLRRG